MDSQPACHDDPVGGLMPAKKMLAVIRGRAPGPSCKEASVGFVGISKTGSLFMQGALESFAHEQLLPSAGARVSACAVGARFGWHHASAALWQRAFGPTAWADAFTFSIVRDPWSRLVSHWAFHLTARYPLDGGFLTREQRIESKLNETRSIEHFRAWIRYATSSYPPGSAEEWRFTTHDAHGNEQAPGFNASQLSWLVNERGELLVDEVFTLETLEQRWPRLQSRICGLHNVSYLQARQHPALLALDHPSCHRPASDYYDAEGLAAVAAYMAPDIRRFGYEPPRPQRDGPEQSLAMRPAGLSPNSGCTVVASGPDV